MSALRGSVELDLAEVRTGTDLKDVMDEINSQDLMLDGVRVMLVGKPEHLATRDTTFSRVGDVVLRLEWDL